jgi:hypothetical protein
LSFCLFFLFVLWAVVCFLLRFTQRALIPFSKRLWYGACYHRANSMFLPCNVLLTIHV